MKVLLSRWQFGVTITYHFLFVPLTIGLALLVAVMQVLAYTRKDETWERPARFFGTLFLINFAMGVVTGIVQEFQFGMNWSNYSVFVGNIFGAPLAMEGLLAFFAESTFIGLWLFGRNRLPALVHTLSICVVSLATIVSAFFILAANAWMQHPVGYRVVGGKAWPGWSGPGQRRCGPGGSARSSSACWSSWPWARPRCCRGCRTRPGGCRSAGRRWTGWPISAGCPCR
jgi:cytochrome d ubiquinol oxidase subunit I